MRCLRPLLLAAAVIGASAAVPRAAAAQNYVPQPQMYLLTTDVFDGRALWVQPAGMAKRRESSISAMFTGNRDSSGTGLGQYGVTLASGGVGFGWQHDRLPGGAHADAYVVGYAAGNPQISIGGDRRWHRGTNTKDAAWDAGLRYSPSTLLELSLVWRDIGSPVVDSQTIKATVVPAAAVRLLGGRLRVGADWEMVQSGWGTSAIRAGAAVILPGSLVLTFRSEFDAGFTTRNIALGLSWTGAKARITGFGQSVHGDAADHAGAWGSVIADPSAPRRRGR